MVSKEGASHLQTMIVVCALVALVILLRYAIAGRLSRSHLIGFCVMQLPALLQIAWFESMRPHSLEHPWVVRGLFLLGICPVLGALVVARQLRATRFA
jgi:hypothetical protein